VSGPALTILALAVITFAIKAAGPVLLGGRELPPRVMAVITLLAPALLAGLVMVETFSEGDEIVLDPRAAGLAAAAGALALRAPMLVTVGLAAVVTAGLRAVI
jgi:uncharacterized membrane protein